MHTFSDWPIIMHINASKCYTMNTAFVLRNVLYTPVHWTQEKTREESARLLSVSEKTGVWPILLMPDEPQRHGNRQYRA